MIKAVVKSLAFARNFASDLMGFNYFD